jgi:putative membrane protein
MKEGRLSRTLGVIAAFLLFLISGLLGLAVLDLPVQSPFGLPATVLFPTLSGLFGTSTLLESVRGGAEVPRQRIEIPELEPGELGSSVTTGGIAGSVVGFLPGMSGGVATVVAMIFRKDPSPKSVILTLSAINTANSFFVLGALFLIMRPRSGAAIVVDELMDVKPWSGAIPPLPLSLLLLAAIVASALGFFLTLFLGKKLANIMPRIPYGKLAWGIIIFITVMVFAFTGPLGVLVLIVSTSVGMIAPNIGIRRSHAMGVLLLPVIIMIW